MQSNLQTTSLQNSLQNKLCPRVYQLEIQPQQWVRPEVSLTMLELSSNQGLSFSLLLGDLGKTCSFCGCWGKAQDVGWSANAPWPSAHDRFRLHMWSNLNQYNKASLSGRLDQDSYFPPLKWGGISGKKMEGWKLKYCWPPPAIMRGEQSAHRK